MTVVDTYRVVYHPHVCPECGSANVTQAEVETGDGITETALCCQDCGAAWPVACVTDWQHPHSPEVTGYERTLALGALAGVVSDAGPGL